MAVETVKKKKSVSVPLTKLQWLKIAEMKFERFD